MPTFDSLKNEYVTLFNTCVPSAKSVVVIDSLVGRIVAGRARYETVESELKVPWYFIGTIHMMECSCDFTKHLHNGDSLRARTVKTPRGRPVVGNPPFTWEQSANDALVYEGFANASTWDIATMLYRLELYNGMGYRRPGVGIHTPYLWSMSNHYVSGKYLEEKGADGKYHGVYHPEVVSKQCGAAVIIRQMQLRKIIT